MEATYKLTLLLTRHPELTADQFADAWLALERHRPLVASGLEGYVFNRAILGDSPIIGAPAAPYDAVIETWWRRKNGAADCVVSREFENDWLAPRLELLADRPAAVGGEPVLVWQRDETASTDPVKIFVMPVARRNLRFGEFVEHWLGTHSKLALSGPGTRERLLRIENTPAAVSPPSRFVSTRYDGIGALTFVSPDALRAEFGSAYYGNVMVPDEARFTNTVSSVAFVGKPIDLI